MRRGLGWVFFVSRRWFKKGQAGGASLVPAALGIGVGVTALIVILGVMNGFQMGFIDAVLSIDSYHLRLEEQEDFDYRQLDALPGVEAVLPFSELKTMVRNQSGRLSAMKLKILPPDPVDFDPDLVARLNLVQGSPQLDQGIMIGNEMARQLRVGLGDSLSILLVTSSEEAGLNTEMISLPVTAIFHSSYYDFDAGLAFVGTDAAWLEGREYPLVYGLKLKDRFSDARIMQRLASLGYQWPKMESWRSYNRAFFGALRIEKTIMLLLVGIIFLVVGVNIFYAMRKSIFERMDEIAILKAMGGRLYAVRRIFVLNGLVAGAAGSIAGLVLGLAISLNVNAIFAAVEAILAFLAGLSGGSAFRFFSPDIFYLVEVPVRLMFSEVAFIAAAGVLAALSAAWVASGRIIKFRPAEVLRHE